MFNESLFLDVQLDSHLLSFNCQFTFYSSECVHAIGEALVNHGAKDLWLLRYMRKLMACRDEFIQNNKVRLCVESSSHCSYLCLTYKRKPRRAAVKSAAHSFRLYLFPPTMPDFIVCSKLFAWGSKT